MTSRPSLPECTALARYAAAPVEKSQRPRGRPKTRTDEHYAALHAEYQRISEWFTTVVGRPAKSDAELLAAYFGEHYEREGLRRSRAFANDFTGRMKTLRNELSRARTLWRTSSQPTLNGACELVTLLPP